jgi:Mad3/BUB1 homology region 2
VDWRDSEGGGQEEQCAEDGGVQGSGTLIFFIYIFHCPHPLPSLVLMKIGLIHGLGGILYFQSLSQMTTSAHIVLPPSQHQVIVNPANGKRERIFIDLEACYPTPEEPGTELSFEEIWAAKRGWLDQSWEDESSNSVVLVAEEDSSEVEALSRQVAEKLVVQHETVMLDENGAMIKSKGKKMKVMEVNETQISTCR